MAQMVHITSTYIYYLHLLTIYSILYLLPGLPPHSSFCLPNPSALGTAKVPLYRAETQSRILPKFRQVWGRSESM